LRLSHHCLLSSEAERRTIALELVWIAPARRLPPIATTPGFCHCPARSSDRQIYGLTPVPGGGGGPVMGQQAWTRRASGVWLMAKRRLRRCRAWGHRWVGTASGGGSEQRPKCTSYVNATACTVKALHLASLTTKAFFRKCQIRRDRLGLAASRRAGLSRNSTTPASLWCLFRG
jgi:hypothetical protein